MEREIIYVADFRLDEPCPCAVGLLDSTEWDRASRFVRNRDRRRFVSAHVWTRLVIGHCLGRAPGSLQFVSGFNGKPRLVDVSCDLRFSLSHSGDTAVLALAIGREVGIDVEEPRPIEAVSLARQFFAVGEYADIDALPAQERQPAFFRVWTRKESFVKALGVGLSFPLDGFEMSSTTEALPQLLRSCRADPDTVHRWRTVSLTNAGGHPAALTAQAGVWRVVQWSRNVLRQM